MANLLNSNSNLRSKGQGTKKKNSYQHQAWPRSLLQGLISWVVGSSSWVSGAGIGSTFLAVNSCEELY